MELYGLIGRTLTHSFSPEYFKNKFNKQNINAEYRLFEINTAEKLPEIINKNPALKGLNVTIPFKKDVLHFLDWIDEPAQKTGSVNTIKLVNEDGQLRLKGYNTDIIGFEKALKLFITNRKGLKALILGTGGSAQAVAYVLKQLKVHCLYVSRFTKGDSYINYASINLEMLQSHQLIINTTPVGMFPHIHESPEIPYHHLTKKNYLFDLIYNPNETSFLRNGREFGTKVTNGLKMLEFQADESWHIWQSK